MQPRFATIAAKDVTASQVESLSLKYQNGVPVLTVRGDSIPIGIKLVAANGNLVAGYAVNVLRQGKAPEGTLTPVTVTPKSRYSGLPYEPIDIDWEYPGKQGCAGGDDDPRRFVVGR